ncbi:RCC1/BLIP-II [Dissoconium aciculare CBS 342.82]|uniref:RCC1/BLIP-II n=1 Tax=Dissoconium aciculare CBS 342.82 TaxID=1314786 RepID=A0A6J3MDV9_9PEZI|nr:RCC1/BLIP-II [Dissoconium aciculare CBS 342.82]KAF1826058.1 RCC1/BLIP-II [Dissoconium aciculare CBS 342.82]
MSQNRLYAFGSNGSGQLGIGHAIDVSEPTEVLLDSNAKHKKIVNIASGGNHTLILFHDGTVISHGDNDDGRCLHHSEDDSWAPRNDSSIADTDALSSNGVSHIAATWAASIVVSGSTAVRVIGSGEFGQLGLGPGATISVVPTLIEDFPPHGLHIVKLAACMAHVVAVLSNGEVWGWGAGRKGQLGRPAEIVWAPRKIEGINFPVVDVACGKDFTCIFGDSQEGKCVFLGLDRNDRFNLKGNVPQQIPDWEQVASSWGCLFVRTNTGQIVAWGRNDHGQLPPKDLPPLKAFAVGSEHCVGLTKAGIIVAWGWGEHGNCGRPGEDLDEVEKTWVELESGDEVSAVFAGCATSFFATTTPAMAYQLSL